MRRLLRTGLLMLLPLAGAARAEAPPPPAWQPVSSNLTPQGAVTGAVRDLRNERWISLDALLDQLAAAPRVVVGERHDQLAQHLAERWLVEALQARRPQGSVLLEMLDDNQQAAVDAARAAVREGRLDPASAALPQALNWQPGWPWEAYGPLLQSLVRIDLPLQAADLGRDEVRRLYAQPQPLSGRLSTAPRVRLLLQGVIAESHCRALPPPQLQAMTALQQQRDRRLAQRLLAAPTPALLIAGGWHADRRAGVPRHVGDLAPGQRLLVLQLLPEGEPLPPADSADLVWITPAERHPDPCAASPQAAPTGVSP